MYSFGRFCLKIQSIICLLTDQKHNFMLAQSIMFKFSIYNKKEQKECQQKVAC